MEKLSALESDRFFEVWSYTVSHGQLLIRSNKSDGYRTRLDILFKDVCFMALPSVMRGLVITECDAIDNDWLSALGGFKVSDSWFRIESEGQTGYVAAGALLMNEDELDFFEPTPLLPPFQT